MKRPVKTYENMKPQTIATECSSTHVTYLIEDMCADISTLHDLVIRCLPYIECAENDPHYKQDGVRKLTREIRKEVDL